jgi:phosphoribulokinase
MPDYVHYICPQFAETDINFQRVPTVDTSIRSSPGGS